MPEYVPIFNLFNGFVTLTAQMDKSPTSMQQHVRMKATEKALDKLSNAHYNSL